MDEAHTILNATFNGVRQLNRQVMRTLHWMERAIRDIDLTKFHMLPVQEQQKIIEQRRVMGLAEIEFVKDERLVNEYFIEVVRDMQERAIYLTKELNVFIYLFI